MGGFQRKLCLDAGCLDLDRPSLSYVVFLLLRLIPPFRQTNLVVLGWVLNSSPARTRDFHRDYKVYKIGKPRMNEPERAFFQRLWPSFVIDSASKATAFSMEMGFLDPRNRMRRLWALEECMGKSECFGVTPPICCRSLSDQVATHSCTGRAFVDSPCLLYVLYSRSDEKVLVGFVLHVEIGVDIRWETLPPNWSIF